MIKTIHKKRRLILLKLPIISLHMIMYTRVNLLLHKFGPGNKVFSRLSGMGTMIPHVNMLVY